MEMQAQLKMAIISVVSLPHKLSCALGVNNIYFFAALDKINKNTKCAGYVTALVLQIICTGLNLYYNRDWNALG
jgi:hypothetical protein